MWSLLTMWNTTKKKHFSFFWLNTNSTVDLYYASSSIRRANLKTELSLRKRIKCFVSSLCRGNLKTQQSPPFWICVLGKLRQGNNMKVFTSSCSKCSPSTLKGKVSVFKFLQFEEHFPKVPFSCRSSVNGRPNHRNKAPFSRIFALEQGVILEFYNSYRCTFSPGLISQVICFNTRGNPSLYFRSNSSITIFPE